MIVLSSCPVCNSSYSDGDKLYSRNVDTIYKCKNCKTLFASPQYTFKELESLYKENYWENDEAMGEYQHKEHLRNKEIYRLILTNIQKRYFTKFPSNSTPPKLLDFGCGPGYLMYESKQYGFDPLGIELSNPAANFARKQYGLNIIEGSEGELSNFPNGHFDIITCWSVLEHLFQPQTLLREFQRVLKPGGFLCISMPNVNSYQHLLRKEKWSSVNNPTHIVFMTGDYLEHVLAQMGFGHFYRPVFFGGIMDMSFPQKVVQYAGRLLNIGSSTRLDAEKL